jgi:hypothetical protein
MPLGHVPKKPPSSFPWGVPRSKDRLPKLKNYVKLPNLIATSKQKRQKDKRNGHKKVK